MRNVVSPVLGCAISLALLSVSPWPPRLLWWKFNANNKSVSSICYSVSQRYRNLVQRKMQGFFTPFPHNSLPYKSMETTRVIIDWLIKKSIFAIYFQTLVSVEDARALDGVIAICLRQLYTNVWEPLRCRLCGQLLTLLRCLSGQYALILYK